MARYERTVAVLQSERLGKEEEIERRVAALSGGDTKPSGDSKGDSKPVPEPGTPTRAASAEERLLAPTGLTPDRSDWVIAVRETVILLHPHRPPLGFSIGMERGCQQE